MKKRGFTLIELLAVIVVLAIIALITIPVITGVVEKTRKGAAKTSALNYVRAIELKIATDSLSGKNYEDKDDYAYDEIDTKAKGKLPTGGMYSLQKGIVTYANFCINNYVVTYENSKAEVGEKCNGEDLKRRASLKVSKSSTLLTYPSEEEIEITENTSGGELSCSTGDSSIATCEISENKVIVKSGKKEGHTTITLTSAETSKYKEAKAAILVSTEEGLLSISANGYKGVYDGNAHGISVISSGATIKYGTVEGTYDLDESPTYTDVGEYTVYYEVSKEGYKTVRGNKIVKIKEVVSCVLQVTEDGVSFASKTPSNVEYGMNTTGTPEYNSIDSLGLSTGTFYGYVKDSDGFTESCSATLTEPIQSYTKTTGTCVSYTYATYGMVTTSSSYEWSFLGISSMTSCSASTVGQTGKYYTSTGQTRCAGTYNGSCMRTDTYYLVENKVCAQTGTSTGYKIDGTTSLTGQTSCESSSFACDASHVNQHWVFCWPTGTTCSSGTKLNDSYCYTIN